MSVVDASVWVSAFLPGDSHHAACRAWLERTGEGALPIVAPALLLPELAAAISRRTGRPPLARRAVRTITRLPVLRLLPIDAPLAERAAQLASNLGLRGADSIYVAAADLLALPLVTLDRDQARRARAVVRLEPPTAD